MIAAAHSEDAKIWLPKESLFDGKLSVAIESIIRAWAANWFVAENRSFSFSYSGNSQHTSEHGLGAGWSCGSAGLCLALSDAGRRQIASRILGVDILKHHLTTRDSLMIGKLVLPVVDDLIKRFSKFLAIPPITERLSALAFADKVRESYERFSIKFEFLGNSIELYIKTHCAMSARRTLTKPLSPTPELSSRWLAVKSQNIGIGARVGTAKLGYAELCELSVGDVIVLDKRLIDGLDITINGQVDTNVNCEIETESGQTMLRLIAI